MIQKLVSLRWRIFALLLIIAAGAGGWLLYNEHEIASYVPAFTIKKLEAPESEAAFDVLVQQIWIMGQLQRVNNDLFVDYLFMPGAYGSIAVALLLLSRKAPRWFAVCMFFAAGAMLLPWIFDLIENALLLESVNSGALSIKAKHLRMLVNAKFAIAYGGAAVIVAALIIKLVGRKRWHIA